MDIRFLGHACFELTDGDTRVLVDPFLTGNPKAAVEASELDPTHIFLTHGHADHYGDVVDIAKRTGAQTVAIVEIAGELGRRASRTWRTRTWAAPWSSTAAGCGSCPPGTPPRRPRARRTRRPGS